MRKAVKAVSGEKWRGTEMGKEREEETRESKKDRVANFIPHTHPWIAVGGVGGGHQLQCHPAKRKLRCILRQMRDPVRAQTLQNHYISSASFGDHIW